MPWEVTSVMEARQRFLEKLESGESMSEACRESHVSRVTGYKWQERYAKEGTSGLKDRSRRPQRSPQKTPVALEERVLQTKRQHRSWGPKKIRALLVHREPLVDWPAVSTMGEILSRAGMVDERKTRQKVPRSTEPLSHAVDPNDLWSLDFKGEFRLLNGKYCFPLTVTDNASRMILGCFSLSSTEGSGVRASLERVFDQYGLPKSFRSDNGAPFASRGLLGLSTLSSWWLSLGILHERTEPGHPEQNGRHERMHLTLKKETTRPPAQDHAGQQIRFDDFRLEFNEVRPHESLGGKTPDSLYVPSLRALSSVVPYDYSLFDDVKPVYACGSFCFLGKLVALSRALVGHQVGLVELEDDVWLVHFCGKDLGLFEVGDNRVSPLDEDRRRAADYAGSPSREEEKV